MNLDRTADDLVRRGIEFYGYRRRIRRRIWHSSLSALSCCFFSCCFFSWWSSLGGLLLVLLLLVLPLLGFFSWCSSLGGLCGSPLPFAVAVRLAPIGRA